MIKNHTVTRLVSGSEQIHILEPAFSVLHLSLSILGNTLTGAEKQLFVIVSGAFSGDVHYGVPKGGGSGAAESG
ncbi:hypothetical protein KOW79_006687 [Hemibagrus wyckioides]|uniref:Uncharacterized protein n=1 Tax=Hemibagrus wyckioides TaxID=337641 RepID=A0A9D3P077_9TELE|nr:hypothetical protein KOW79_006687 [Hemibagrus wyckioides]